MTRSDHADHVVLSYPADLSDWGRQRVDSPAFRAYLRKAHRTAAAGDVFEEFVGVGCCGDTLDVPLRVERVEGGEAIDADTTIEFDVRDACGIQGGWLVQSRAGPAGGDPT